MAYGVMPGYPQPRLPFLLVQGVSRTVRGLGMLLSAKLTQQRAHEKRKERKAVHLLLPAKLTGPGKLTGPAKLTGYPATCP